MAVRSLGGSPVSTVAVTREYLYLDDSRVGVDYSSTSNQAAKVQAAWDLAASAAGGAGGTVFVGGRVQAGNTSLLWPSQGGGRGQLRVLGSGSADSYSESPSGIYWDTDTATAAPAAGDHASTTFGIRIPTDALPWRLEKLTLQGPGGTVPVGTLPAKMRGVFCPTRGLMNDVTINRFGAGVGLINDHQVFRDCDWRGNGYGVDFMDNAAGGLGDILFDRVFLTGQSCASIALANSNCIANARFIQGHAGANPFGIYRYVGQEADRNQALQGVVFENWSWEYCGNAMFYDEANTGHWGNVVFDSPAEAGTGGSAKWPGKPWPMAKIHISSGSGFHWRDGPGLPQGDSPEAPLVSAKDFYDFTMDDATYIADTILANSHKSFVLRGGGFGSKFVGGRMGNRSVGPGGIELGACVAQEDIRKGALVETFGTNQVRESRNSATSDIRGASLIAYSAGDVCFFASYGYRALLTVINDSGSTIAQNAILAADSAHQGGVKTWASPSDGQQLGRVHDTAITSGTLGPATMRVR